MVLPAAEEARNQAERFRPDAADGGSNDPLYEAIAGGSYFSAVSQAVERLVASMDDRVRQLWDFARSVGQQVDKHNTRQFRMSVRHHYGVDVLKSEPWLVPELKSFEAENLRLIKSIPRQHADKLQGEIMQALRRGDTNAELARIVQDVSGATADRADLIAADQVGKLNAQMTKLRQQNIGVKTALWRGVLDRRERPTHRALEGVEFSWDNPPLGGPGHEIRCRCWAEAVFPSLAGVEGTISP
jgi:SPP1 gp7 family putative phage head morphogenesis protein